VSEPGDLDQLRVEALAARGLPAAAVQLVVGATVSEIEASADDLAQLVRQRVQTDTDELPEFGPSGTGELPEFGPNFFGAARADRERRRREFLDALSGRPQQQPHDELGRFASYGFDGGARTSPPAPAPTHDQTLSMLFASKAADVGRHI